MRVAITGGAGFIGGNLTAMLARDPRIAALTVIDDFSTGVRGNLEGIEDVRLIEASILDEQALIGALDNVDAVVHLAARPSVARSVLNPEATHAVNVTGTVRVLEAARRSGKIHVVFAGSSSVYGANPALPKHEGLVPAPLSPYAASKLAAESYVLAYAACYDLPVLAFRLFNVFGPLQTAGHAYAAVIPAFVDAAMSGRPLPLHGDGTQTRDFTYVGSVCTLIREALVRRVTWEGPVNLAFGTRRSLKDVIAMLEGIIGHRLAVLHTPPRVGDVPHSQAATQRLSALFPDLHAVDFAEGLEATVRWARRERERERMASPSTTLPTRGTPADQRDRL